MGPGPGRGLGYWCVGWSVGKSVVRRLGYEAPKRTVAGCDQERLAPYTAFSSHGQWLLPLIKGRAVRREFMRLSRLEYVWVRLGTSVTVGYVQVRLVRSCTVWYVGWTGVLWEYPSEATSPYRPSSVTLQLDSARRPGRTAKSGGCFRGCPLCQYCAD